MPQNPADVGEKAHVEHAVGLVEHEVLETGQLRVRHAEMIEQTARRADDHVDAASERMFLRSHADAPEHRRGAQRRARQVVEIFENLGRELACGVSTSARVTPRGRSSSL